MADGPGGDAVGVAGMVQRHSDSVAERFGKVAHSVRGTWCADRRDLQNTAGGEGQTAGIEGGGFASGIRPQAVKGKITVKYLITWLIGLVTMATATFFFCGYIFSVKGFYTIPSNGTPVALPTCILFFLVGFAIAMLSCRGIHRKP